VGEDAGNEGERRRRARLALEGLSVGDAFGERFFGPPEKVIRAIESRAIAGPPWRYTDDTEMALSIVEQLEERGAIDQDDLALRFARRMDLARGYGHGAVEILSGILQGRSWRSVARDAFRGMGSFGNGAAMRVSPLGAYFADDLDRVVHEAAASAEVTHAHPEGIAGAIAVAVAAALCATTSEVDAKVFLETVLRRVPAGHTRDGLEEALALPKDVGAIEAAKTLGNGSGVTAPDTVPFCLWVVAHHLREPYEEALWATVSGLGDRDTTCAIVGGVIVLRSGFAGLPRAWWTSRERLPI
jgi:ADP-ribosylglycohydrolase